MPVGFGGGRNLHGQLALPARRPRHRRWCIRLCPTGWHVGLVERGTGQLARRDLAYRHADERAVDAGHAGRIREGAGRREDRPPDEHACQSRSLLRQRRRRRGGDRRHGQDPLRDGRLQSAGAGEPVGQLADHGRSRRIPVRDNGPLFRFQRCRRIGPADDDVRADPHVDRRRQDGRADGPRPGAHRVRHHCLGAGRPHSLHRRLGVQRRSPGRVGRALLELDRRLRFHHPARARGGRAWPRPDQRRSVRREPQGLFRTPARRGACALRRWHGLARRGARHPDQGIRPLDRPGARRGECLFALQAMGPGHPARAAADPVRGAPMRRTPTSRSRICRSVRSTMAKVCAAESRWATR